MGIANGFFWYKSHFQDHFEVVRVQEGMLTFAGVEFPFSMSMALSKGVLYEAGLTVPMPPPEPLDVATLQPNEAYFYYQRGPDGVKPLVVMVSEFGDILAPGESDWPLDFAQYYGFFGSIVSCKPDQNAKIYKPDLPHRHYVSYDGDALRQRVVLDVPANQDSITSADQTRSTGRKLRDPRSE